jgi:pSer/pThr/pTyr-binding forkhead associated (FHA) protein
MTLQFRFVSAQSQIPDLRICPQENPIVVGRSLSVDAPVPDAMVSRRHCELDCRDGRLVIRDLGSTNGTIVNGRPIDADCELEPGDVVLLGVSEFRVMAGEETGEFEDDSVPMDNLVIG